MRGIWAQIVRGAIAGVVAVAGGTAAISIGLSWAWLVEGNAAASVIVATLTFAAAGAIVFTGDVSAIRAAISTIGAHAVAIAVAVPVGMLANPLTDSVMHGAFTFVVAGIAISALLCRGGLNGWVIGSALAIVVASTVVPAQGGGDLAWSAWFALVIAAWTIIPIAARHAAERRLEPFIADG